MSGRPDSSAVAWSHAFLKAGGWPDSAANVVAVTAWQMQEGGPPDNPLNIGPGRHFGGQGIAESVAVTRQNNMAGINRALTEGRSVATTMGAIDASPWGTHWSGGAQGIATRASKAVDANKGGGIGLADVLDFAGNPIAGVAGIIGDGNPVAGVIDSGKAVIDLAGTVAAAAKWLANPLDAAATRHHWWRLAEAAIGFVAILLGLDQLGHLELGGVVKKGTELALMGA